MNDKPCSRIVGLLVDYADGELSAADHRRVAEHVAGCAGCRAELRLLQRSLELAQVEWRQAARRPSPPAPLPKGEGSFAAGRFHPRGRRVLAACVAASAVVVFWASIAWWPSRPKSGSQPEVAIAQPEASPPQALSEEEIDAFISRQTRTARLAVAVKLLASQPGLEDYKTQAERYLAEVSAK